MNQMGKIFIILGIILIVLGIVLIVFKKIPFKLGRLPGDIFIKKENYTFTFPLTTSILISIIVTIILWLIFRFLK